MCCFAAHPKAHNEGARPKKEAFSRVQAQKQLLLLTIYQIIRILRAAQAHLYTMEIVAKIKGASSCASTMGSRTPNFDSKTIMSDFGLGHQGTTTFSN